MTITLTRIVLEPICHRLALLRKVVQNLWLFTESDVATFVVPNTIFGVAAALAGSSLASLEPVTKASILSRIPSVILFNWSNLLVFDLANQRLWESVTEDRINKPWRPIPSGRMTRREVRQAMQLIIPLVLALNHYLLHVGAETVCIATGTWVYNDLKMSDDNWFQRNMIISLAFGVFNWSSLKIAVGGGGSSSMKVSDTGTFWIILTSGVVLTTMHIQDLKDIEGDRARGRETAPLFLGQRLARWSLAIPIILWGPICAFFWDNKVTGSFTTCLGAYVALRCLWYHGNRDDRWTWQLWCAWTVCLSLLPIRPRYSD